MIAAADDIPGLTPRVDVPAPCERLIGDSEPSPACVLGQLVELIRDASRISTASAATEEQTSMVSVPSSSITANLCSGRRTFASSRPGCTVSKSRNGWYRSIDRPRSAHRLRTSAGCRRRCDQVVLEYLDAVEADGRDRVKFVLQRARQAHRGDCSSDAAFVAECCRHLRILHCAGCVDPTISPPPDRVKALATEWKAPES